MNDNNLTMSIEEIQSFLDKKKPVQPEYVRISFKNRDAVFGLFVRDHKDYGELKSKNFWRIVTKTHFDAYSTSNDVGLAKIFNGSAFTRLSVFKDEME
jgi:hypothetical protein